VGWQYGVEVKDLLSTDGELNLYLVANSLKPSTMIDLSTRSSKLHNSRVTKEEYLDGKVRYVTLRFNSDVVDDLKSLLDESDVVYVSWEQESVSEVSSEGIKTEQQIGYNHMFDVGSNRLDLERLLSAKTDEEIGLALGFPTEAVEAFEKVIDGERRDGTYDSISKAKAKQVGLELPTWLAYICFVPENLDLVNGNVSPSSKALGERYQNFVRENNPELAARVEQNFLNRNLPHSWEKLPTGSYTLNYKRQLVLDE